jgi:hypothetical protein
VRTPRLHRGVKPGAIVGDLDGQPPRKPLTHLHPRF